VVLRGENEFRSQGQIFSGWIPAYGTGGDPAIGRIENQLPIAKAEGSRWCHEWKQDSHSPYSVGSWRRSSRSNSCGWPANAPRDRSVASF
jgi:hypothetical protein